MKNFKKGLALSKSKGFTLIELLIVIALLGSLAVALLAALDPLEQVKKGTDTGVRNTVAEIQSAAVRYSAIKGGLMPFGAGTLTWGAVGTAGTTVSYSAIQNIINTGELKTDFFKLAGSQLNSIFMTGINDAASGTQKVAACFVPTSKSFKADNNTKWTDSGVGTVTDATPCTNGTTAASAACYWCVQ